MVTYQCQWTTECCGRTCIIWCSYVYLWCKSDIDCSIINICVLEQHKTENQIQVANCQRSISANELICCPWLHGLAFFYLGVVFGLVTWLTNAVVDLPDFAKISSLQYKNKWPIRDESIVFAQLVDFKGVSGPVLSGASGQNAELELLQERVHQNGENCSEKYDQVLTLSENPFLQQCTTILFTCYKN